MKWKWEFPTAPLPPLTSFKTIINATKIEATVVITVIKAKRRTPSDCRRNAIYNCAHINVCVCVCIYIYIYVVVCAFSVIVCAFIQYFPTRKPVSNGNCISSNKIYICKCVLNYIRKCIYVCTYIPICNANICFEYSYKFHSFNTTKIFLEFLKKFLEIWRLLRSL